MSEDEWKNVIADSPDKNSEHGNMQQYSLCREESCSLSSLTIGPERPPIYPATPLIPLPAKPRLHERTLRPAIQIYATQKTPKPQPSTSATRPRSKFSSSRARLPVNNPVATPFRHPRSTKSQPSFPIQSKSANHQPSPTSASLRLKIKKGRASTKGKGE